MASVAELSLKEAKKIYPKPSIIKVNYKSHIFHYCTLATLGEGTFGKVLKGWKKVSYLSVMWRRALRHV